MSIFESIVTTLAGLTTIAVVVVPLVLRIGRVVTADKTVFDHLSCSLFERRNRWCTVEHISTEENLTEKAVQESLLRLQKKGLVKRSRDEEAVLWTLTDFGIERFTAK